MTIEKHDIVTSCTYCRRIRTEHDRWVTLDQTVISPNTARVSHSACPDCYRIAIFRLLEEIHVEVKNRVSM